MAEPDTSPPNDSSSPSDPENTTPQKPTSKLGYLDAFALIVAMEIGSGIFASTAQINKNAPSPGFALILWLICGLLAWCGATCFAELGVTLPLNGGMQEYHRYIFGDGLGFTTSWLWIMATKPCSVAIQSITFAQYWVNVVLAGGSASGVDQNGWQTKVLALVAFYFICVLNAISLDTSASMMRFFTVAKILGMVLLLLFAILSAGFHVHRGAGKPPTDWYTKNWFAVQNPAYEPGLWNVLGHSVIGIYAGLWAFSGYDSANQVAGDIKDPARNLPRALHTAQPLVITSYLVANVCYYVTVPWADIDANNAIAVTVGNSVAGWIGGLVFAILVSLACIGSVSVNVFTTSRLIVSAAEANWLPHGLGKYSTLFKRKAKQPDPKIRQDSISSDPSREPLLARVASNIENTTAGKAPIRAIVFMAALTTVFILLGTFGSLVTFTSLLEYTFFTITMVGGLILRRREPDLPRPYKPFIAIPLIFVTAGACLVVVGIFEAPIQAGIIILFVIAGYGRMFTMQQLRKRRERNGALHNE